MLSRSFVFFALMSVFTLACSRGGGPTAPTITAGGAQGVSAAGTINLEANAEQPPFNVEAVLRGDGFGLVKFRQQRDLTRNVIDLDVWVRDLSPITSYSLQRATDTALDSICTGANWLTLGKGLIAEPIVTDENGTGRAALWRDLSALAPGVAFDIHFRVIENATNYVALQSDCYRYIVRD
jgi:hypothetical protein